MGRVKEARRFRFKNSKNARDAALGAHPAAIEESFSLNENSTKESDADDSKYGDFDDVNVLVPENVKVIDVGANNFEIDVLGDVGGDVGGWEA